MEFSRPEYPFPSPGDLPDPGIQPGSPALQADSLPAELPGKSQQKVANGSVRGGVWDSEGAWPSCEKGQLNSKVDKPGLWDGEGLCHWALRIKEPSSLKSRAWRWN